MQIKRYYLSSRANTDLEDILDYIAEDNLQASRELYEKLAGIFQKLMEMPSMGRKRKDLAKDLQSFPVGNYNIFYRIKNEELEIVRVLHGARDIQGKWFH